ncbi:MAG: porin [Herminiimonas sp.]|nr:porin [Herminiimonas sp.]
MKKAFFALAVLGAVSGAAFAQSSVEVYGIVDMGLVHENNGTTSATRLDSGNVYGSRLGFRGTEDLGGGLSALFNLESGFNVDTGAGQGPLFNRQSFVGLKGSAGTVTLGRQYTTLFRAQLAYDPFFTGFAGNAGRMMSNGGGPNGARTDNSIFYVTPTVNGFEGQLQYGLGEQAGDNSKLRETGAAVGYAKDRLSMKLAYHNANDATGNTSTKNTNLSGTYDFGVAKVYAAYQLNKTDSVLDTRDGLIGVSVPFGAGKFIASYIRKNDRINANANATQLAAGYIYGLSKRTDLYTSVSNIKNDSGSSIRVLTGGNSDRLFNAGISHKF